jgi:hypothetical protein
MTSTHPSTSTARGGLRSVVTAFALALASTVAGSASGAITPIFDSVGFEQPKFNTNYAGGNYMGQLEGQAVFGEPYPVYTWEQTKPIGVYTSRAQVVGNMPVAPASGAQSVKVTRAADTDARWGVRGGAWPSERYVCIDWDMYVEQTVLPVGSFGPYFAVEAYDDDAANIGLLTSLGVDAANGEVLYQASDPVFNGSLVAAGPVVNFNQWNSFTILLDYLTHTFDIYLNGVQIPTAPGSDSFVDHSVLNPLDEFTDAPIATLAAGGDLDSQNATGTAYYDNYRVVQSDTNPCIPEPASWVLGMLGMAAFAAKGRARRAGK